MAEFVRVLNEKGITYFDWNVSAGDTSSDYTVDDVVTNVTEGVKRYKTSVVLLHDGDDKSTTVEALEPLIQKLQQMKAEILPIDEIQKSFNISRQIVLNKYEWRKHDGII